MVNKNIFEVVCSMWMVTLIYCGHPTLSFYKVHFFTNKINCLLFNTCIEIDKIIFDLSLFTNNII